MSRQSTALVVLISLAAACDGRPIPTSWDGPASSADGSALADAGLVGFCQGQGLKLVVDGAVVPGAYSPSHATSQGSGYLSIQLLNSSHETPNAGVAYYIDLTHQGTVTLPQSLDLAALPPAWNVGVSMTHCSAGGTDPCHILGSLSTTDGDSFTGWIKLTGTAKGVMEHATICLSGTPAPSPTHSPVLSIRLYASLGL